VSTVYNAANGKLSEYESLVSTKRNTASASGLRGLGIKGINIREVLQELLLRCVLSFADECMHIWVDVRKYAATYVVSKLHFFLQLALLSSEVLSELRY
jgi:hypothetical protein